MVRSSELSQVVKKLSVQKIPIAFKQKGEICVNEKKRKQSYAKLQKLLDAKGITAYKLAKNLNFSSTLFSDWKSGRSMPKTDKLIKIADYFGVTVDYFLEE